MQRIGLKFMFLLTLAVLACAGTILHAQPGTVLFEDDFERADSGPVDPLGPDYDISVDAFAGINAYPVTTGNSGHTRHGAVEVESPVFDLSAVAGANISVVVERGSDDEFPLSEDPEGAGEAFFVEYLASDLVTWVILAEIPATSVLPAGQVFIDQALPPTALHAGFQFRFRQEGGDGGPPANGGVGFDFWHFDDVELLETGVFLGAPPLAVGSCEEFEDGLGNFTITGPGVAGTTGATFDINSPDTSLFVNEDSVTVTSDIFDATALDEITVWIQRGDDSFSENPDAGEDLIFEFSNDGVNFIEIDTFFSVGTPDAFDEGEFRELSFVMPADFAPSSTFQVRFTLSDASGVGFDFWHIDNLCFLGAEPAQPTVLKTVTVESDPVNGTSNPKAIPGATLLYSITVFNASAGTTDPDTVVISDALNANTTFFAGDLDGNGSPFIFGDGAGSDTSGLSFDFTSLGDATDSPVFLDSSSAEITPVIDFDPEVSSFEITLFGQFLPQGAGTPEFTITYRVRLE